MLILSDITGDQGCTGNQEQPVYSAYRDIYKPLPSTLSSAHKAHPNDQIHILQKFTDELKTETP